MRADRIHRGGPKSVPILPRLEKYSVATETGCWEWQAAKTSHGYGVLRSRGKTLSAHRTAYELLVGPIPKGLHLDHLCRNPACINPEHLEPVTHQENLRRGGRDRMALVSLCAKGHPLDGVCKRGGRYCKTCKRQKNRERYWRNRSA